VSARVNGNSKCPEEIFSAICKKERKERTPSLPSFFQIESSWLPTTKQWLVIKSQHKDPLLFQSKNKTESQACH